MIDQQLKEIAHGSLAPDDYMHVPFVFYLQGDAVPGVECWIVEEFFLVEVKNVLTQHPKSGRKWSINKAFNVVEGETGN